MVLGLLFLQGLTNIRAEFGARNLIISNTDGLLLYIWLQCMFLVINRNAMEGKCVSPCLLRIKESFLPGLLDSSRISCNSLVIAYAIIV